MIYDICLIGSGAGAGPIAYELAKAGKKVIILEKGPWIKTKDYVKDEITATRRSVYTSNLQDEFHELEEKTQNGDWKSSLTFKSSRDFWNGNCVGGSSNFMSGFFSRLKPKDFRLLSEYGKIEGANITNWPLSYSELEPYYEKVERIVGVSGKVVPHSQQEPRSTPDFPFPPLSENYVAKLLDKAAKELNYELIPLPRAILSKPDNGRNSCYYSNFCGSYGCASDAKGSSRAALLNQAVETGNCRISADSKVFKLETDGNFSVKKAYFINTKTNKENFVEAKTFVVAAQAIETSRLLLLSKNPEFPNGLANNSGQVGKNLIFSGGGIGSGNLFFENFSDEEVKKLKLPGLFVNRTCHQFYEIQDSSLSVVRHSSASTKAQKGGIIDFLFEHPNAIPKSIRLKWDKNEKLVYGHKLKRKMEFYFTKQRKIKFEIFIDWLPTNDCFVTLSDKHTDKWGHQVAKIRLGAHPHDLKIGEYIAKKAEEFLKQIGAKNVRSHISASPPPNVVVGGCRFGNHPETSVLDKNCKAHQVKNLYVSDGSFFPTGGSVPPTWTIYANSFRVAEHILKKL